MTVVKKIRFSTQTGGNSLGMSGLAATAAEIALPCAAPPGPLD